LKNILIFSSLLFLVISIPPVFASELNQTLVYDGNGNLITGDGKYREYNEFNQLIRVYNGSINDSDQILEEYVYHPLENRILVKYKYEQVEPDRFGVEEAVAYINQNFEKEYDEVHGVPNLNYTYYLYDDSGIIGEIIKNVSYWYSIPEDRYYEGFPVFVKNIFYHNDYSGSTTLITNQSGSVVENTFYEPFGDILSGGNESRYSYEGQEFDALTDDYDFHFRKYDPNLMIFTQPDSVVADIYDPQTLNRYSFERNNPYKYIDKDGKVAIQFDAGAGYSQPGVGIASFGGIVMSGSKEYGFQFGLSFTSAGGANSGVGEIGYVSGNIGITPKAKRIQDIAGTSESIGVAASYEGVGGGYSFSKGANGINTHTLSYVGGYGAEVSDYMTTTSVYPLFQISNGKITYGKAMNNVPTPSSNGMSCTCSKEKPFDSLFFTSTNSNKISLSSGFSSGTKKLSTQNNKQSKSWNIFRRKSKR